VKAAGPLGKVIEADSTRINPGRDYPARFAFGSGANSLIMMNRIAFFSDREDELDAVRADFRVETCEVLERRAHAARELRVDRRRTHARLLLRARPLRALLRGAD